MSLIAIILAIIAFDQIKSPPGSPPPVPNLPRIGSQGNIIDVSLLADRSLCLIITDNLKIANNSDQIIKNSQSIELVILGLQAMKNESQHLQEGYLLKLFFGILRD